MIGDRVTTSLPSLQTMPLPTVVVIGDAGVDPIVVPETDKEGKAVSKILPGSSIYWSGVARGASNAGACLNDFIYMVCL
jgi:hypothetical protein